ncbi:phosphoglycerol transferase MdoB-like AlkP superfamily enzyme [Bacillus niacini]|uniref:Phosphoglycerol transferase MdoB-like AlkP superfamily enzyme n=2 Tax=Neobacillus TaxID=2675232 RepID=A0A852T4V2_9BACI|nr:phosphoglycerol transferase MdoB-like AlkP superfamily enzyme [Neobacillus niacini]
MKGINHLVSNIRPSKSGLLLALTAGAFSLFTLMIIEVIHRDSFTAFFAWASSSTVSFVITFFLLFFLVGALLFLPTILFITLIIVETIFLFIVSLGSFIKFQLRGEYFTPADLYALNEGADISTLMNDLIGWKEIAGFVVTLLLLLVFCLFFVRLKNRVSFRKRLILSAISILCIAIICTQPSLFTFRSYSKEVPTVESYRVFGFVGAYLTLVEKAIIAVPDHYDKDEVEKIVKTVNATPTEDVVDPDFQPNIIVVLAEAMWDPLLLKNADFKEDPLPYFRSLMQNYSSGSLLTHVYGGGTFNTELEVLSGLSTRFAPEEVYYNQVNRPIDSLAYLLRKQGYHATAIHNFKNWYYTRKDIYELIGFERFFSMEFFNNPSYIGPYIDDRILMKKALSELKNTKGPDFLNVVTVASHGPYNDIRYKDLPILATSSRNMTELSKYILNLYTNLLKDVDDSIRILIEGVKEIDEPTMVVIYGDHLPFLGEEYAVYRELDYFHGDLNNHEEYKKMYQTPLVVWDNFGGETKKEDLRMTPNFLGSYILANAKKEMSPIFRLSRDLYKQGDTVIPKKTFYEEEGVREEDLMDYQLLQYDALKGKQYSYANRNLKPFAGYVLGNGKIKIDSVQVEKENKGTYRLNIRGENFVSGATIFIDGKKKKIKFTNENLISTTIKMNGDSSDETSPHEIRVAVLDDDGKTIIEESNSKTIKLK